MDKALIQKLNGLQNTVPNSEWKKSNRELLLMQISQSDASSCVNVKKSFSLFDFSFIRNLPQPILAVFLIVVIVFGGGFFGVNFSRNSVPGDSLYIAKKINEKAKLALTFDEKKKTRLGLEFAGERAKEIKELLQIEGNGEKQEKVTKLVNEFKKEIQVAKSRIEPSIKNNNSDDMETENDEEESIVFSAGLEKEEKGLQVSENDPLEIPVDEIVDINVTTTTKEQASSSEEVKIEDGVDLLKTIDTLVAQTEELLKKEDTINQEELENLELVIDQISDTGEVKGVSDEASSSEDVLPVVGDGVASSS